MQERAVLRQQLRDRRREIPLAHRQHAEAQICAAAADVIGSPRRAALYQAFDGEVDPAALGATLEARGVEVLFAKRHPERGLSFVEAHTWRETAYGLPVPNGPERTLDADDVVVAPVVAFDGSGNRLGMGGGCYDRALAWCPARRIGLAFECQRMSQLEVLATDQPLSAICTEEKTYIFDGLEHTF